MEPDRSARGRGLAEAWDLVAVVSAADGLAVEAGAAQAAARAAAEVWAVAGGKVG